MSTAVYTDAVKAPSLEFPSQGAGVKIIPITGYPRDNSMPQLQISPEGRFNFFSWPATQFWTTFKDMTYPGNQMQSPRIIQSNEFYYDNVIGDASMGAGGPGSVSNNLYIKQDDPNRQPFFFGIPVIPADKFFVEEFVKAGRPGTTLLDGTLRNTQFRFFSPWTYKAIVSYKGVYMYQALTAFDLVFINIQNFLDVLLNEPYQLYNNVPYGQSYVGSLHELLNGKNRADGVRKYLSAVDFMFAPVGKMTLLDKILINSPTIVATIFSVLSMGAGTPVLAATVASMGLGFAQKDATTRAKIAAQVNGYMQGLNMGGNEKPDIKRFLKERGTLPPAKIPGGGGGGGDDDFSKYIPYLVAAIAIIVIDQQN